MAKKLFLGTAPEVAQVDTITPGGTIEADDRFRVILTDDAGNSSQVMVAAGGTTAADVVTALKASAAAAKAAGTAPWDDVTCSGTDTFIITADTAGVPFYATVETTEANADPADDQTFSLSHTVVNSGPNDLKTAANWSGGTLPVAGDDLYFEQTDVDVLYGLDWSAVAPAYLRISQSFTGVFGPATAFVKLPAVVVDIGDTWGLGQPYGSRRIALDLCTAAAFVTVHATADSSVETSLPVVRLLADNASAKVLVRAGKVGVACQPDQTSELASVEATGQDDESAFVQIGPGVTLDDLIVAGGTAVCSCDLVNLTSRGGHSILTGDSAITGTLTVEDGLVEHIASGNVAHAHFYGGKTDFTGSVSARAVANASIRQPAAVRFDPSIITWTNGLVAERPLTLTAS